MCGIAGIVSLGERPVGADEVQAMCDILAHRGPDDEGFYVRPGVGLGMRRLSIIDLETGHQPVRNEDGTVWAVLNGEIYNFKELRAELTARGHRFYTATDTETIVHLYEEHGPACVERMRGMFAFALWDERRRQLLLARDRLGIKPLFYAECAGRLLFASELKAILEVNDVERRLDWGAVSHFFASLAAPGDRSMVAGLRKLEPGHILVAGPGQALRVERYWDVRFEPDYSRGESALVERLRQTLEESVRLHLVSDVPVGAFLSGGVDSGAVVGYMSLLGHEPVKTFSIGFTDQDYDELTHARLVARAFGTDHHELVLEPDALDLIDEICWHLDEPLGDPSVIPMYMVSKLASESVTVVLSGDGGDELFAGYDKYVVEGRERRREPPAPARWLAGRIAGAMPEGMRGRNFLRHLSLTGTTRYMDATTLFRPEEHARLFRPDVRVLVARHDPWAEKRERLMRANGHWLSALQYADLHGYLSPDILTKVARMSMAHSIEARVPLLDHKLVEFAATIPPELLLRNGSGKYLFKRAMAGVLPAETVHRDKRGFAVPLAAWFRGRLAGA